MPRSSPSAAATARRKAAEVPVDVAGDPELGELQTVLHRRHTTGTGIAAGGTRAQGALERIGSIPGRIGRALGSLIPKRTGESFKGEHEIKGRIRERHAQAMGARILNRYRNK